MESSSIRDQLQDWDDEELGNLIAILGEETDTFTIERVEEIITEKYHSKFRKCIKDAGHSILYKFNKNVKTNDYTTPGFNELLEGAAKKLKVFYNEPSISECELYISHAVIIRGLTRMNPKQRIEFFDKQIDLSGIHENADLKDANLGSIKLATTGLLLAQSSGFGLYMASTTALGFVTHAIGISLPFAAYSGLSSTIAFVIGPIGWLTVGLWGSWLLTGPEWKKLIPAIIYIASTNSRRVFEKNSPKLA